VFRHFNKRALTATAVIVAAGLPSAAAARPLYEDPGSSFTADPPTFQSFASPPVAPAVQGPVPEAQQGFRWDDAGLGAAGMLVLVGVGSGAVVTVRRRGGRALAG
jgi:hypothetical protein